MVHAASRFLSETPSMLEARLELLDRIRKVEHAIAHAEQASTATALMRGRAHDLGNAIQIVKLSSLELSHRVAELNRPDIVELIADMQAEADKATTVLANMIDATRNADRIQYGPVISHAIRAAIETARPAFLTPIELRIDLDDTVHTYCSAEEIEAIVFASALEAAGSPRSSTGATRMTFSIRERVIQSKRWVELLRIDDRQVHDGDYAHMFEAGSLLKVVAQCAKAAGGEASIAPGRSGLELAVELPVAKLP
jgi:nitrogen-specific signal transduction histidine kinase